MRLKNEIEYKGKMANVDPYMNVIIVDAEETENGSKVANYGKVVSRVNYVLFVMIEDRLCGGPLPGAAGSARRGN